MSKGQMRELSSNGIWVNKYGFPGLAAIFTCYAAIAPLLNPNEVHPPMMLKAFSARYFITVLVAAAVTLCLCLTLGRLKEVWMNDEMLVVKGVMRKIVIPLSQVSEVQVNHGRSHSITILLSTPSEFGDEITFEPAGFIVLRNQAEQFARTIRATIEAAQHRVSVTENTDKAQSFFAAPPQ
ncbi:MAG: hypothetical protein HOP19_03955 [Acidobacteria bacterium]|nr:hypothetical protein [Acidobacteriota bacterium]